MYEPKSPLMRWVFFLIGCLPGFLLGAFVALFFWMNFSVGTYYRWLMPGDELSRIHLQTVYEPQPDLESMRRVFESQTRLPLDSIVVDHDRERLILGLRYIDHYGPIVVRRTRPETTNDGRWHLVMGRGHTYDIDLEHLARARSREGQQP